MNAPVDAVLAVLEQAQWPDGRPLIELHPEVLRARLNAPLAAALAVTDPPVCVSCEAAPARITFAADRLSFEVCDRCAPADHAAALVAPHYAEGGPQ